MDLMSRAEERSQSGEGSFTDWYRREWREVVGLGYVLTGNRAVAEDLAQDAFAAAERKWATVSLLDRPGAWVRRVVVNKSVSRLRRLGAERRALQRMGRNDLSTTDLDIDAQIAEVWAAVRGLPRRQAQIVALVHFDGMTVTEAAELVGCGRETARTHLRRGKTTLAQRLGIGEERHD